MHASLTTTEEKLLSNSSALDRAVIKEREAHMKLKATEENMNAQEQQLELAQTALSKREFSSLTVISSVVANAMSLVKNHMPKFDAEILQKDFTIDDAGRATIIDSAYDTAQHFVSLYNFFVFGDSNDNTSPDAL
jgi:hypothetical protein